MLSTDLQYDLSQSHPASLGDLHLDAVRAILDELESQGREKLGLQGVPDRDIEVLRSADMRYLDQVYEVTVDLPNISQSDDRVMSEWAESFHRRYEELYSYSQFDQEIRLVTLRVSVLGRLPRTAPPERLGGESLSGAGKGSRRVYLGSWQEVPIYDGTRLAAGTEIAGPAIVESDFTTLLVEPETAPRSTAVGASSCGSPPMRASRRGPERSEGSGRTSSHWPLSNTGSSPSPER